MPRNKKRSCTDFLVISQDNMLLKFFQLILVIVSVIGTPYYLYMAAWGEFLEKRNSEQYMDNLSDANSMFFWSIELVYAINMALNFLVEFVPEDSMTNLPVRDLAKIATRYYKTELVWDVIAIIPLNQFLKFHHSRLLMIIKCVRFRETTIMFDTGNFQQQLKKLTSKFHLRA
jgi:hypothetical protein